MGVEKSQIIVTTCVSYMIAALCFMQVLLHASAAENPVKTSVAALLALRFGRFMMSGALSFKQMKPKFLLIITILGSFGSLLVMSLPPPYFGHSVFLLAAGLAGMVQASSTILCRWMASVLDRASAIAVFSNVGWAIGTTIPILLPLISKNYLLLPLMPLALGALSFPTFRQIPNVVVQLSKSEKKGTHSTPRMISEFAVILFGSISAGLATLFNANILNILKNKMGANDLQLAASMLVMSALSFALLAKPVARTLEVWRPSSRLWISRAAYIIVFATAITNTTHLATSAILLASVSVIGVIEQAARTQLIGNAFKKEKAQLIHSRSELCGVFIGIGIYFLEQSKMEMLSQLFILAAISLFAGLIYTQTFYPSKEGQHGAH